MDSDNLDVGVDQSNPTGGAVEDDDNVVFFDALAALPAVDDRITTNNSDATSDASLGLSADADDVEPASNPTGLLADGSDVPPATAASLGLPANRSTMLGIDANLGAGPDDVDSDVADPDDGTSGDCTIPRRNDRFGCRECPFDSCDGCRPGGQQTQDVGG